MTFSLFVLGHPKTRGRCSTRRVRGTGTHLTRVSRRRVRHLAQGVVTKLPNSRRDFALRRFRGRLSHCGSVSTSGLHGGLVFFLGRVYPMTSRIKMGLIVRPSSPPVSVLNLPHVVDARTSFGLLIRTMPGPSGKLYLYYNSFNMSTRGSLPNVVRH